MCGICGIIHDEPARPVERNLLEAMNRTMIHRGPDDEGYFVGRGSGLGVRRLSIMDVQGGHQPMSSEDGKVYAVCNGEIYNFRELRSELEGRGHVFRSCSDSEVLPHLYEESGADLPQRLNGMFGLAVWDEPERTLILARDRMGEKPLYWTHQHGIFAFGSELKAIIVHPEINPSVDRSSLSKYLAFEYIPAPHTIFEGINKLEPGHLLILRKNQVTVRSYWDVPTGREIGGVSEKDAAREILRLLEQSVQRRLMSDVPLGVFLSGGVDSSSIVAMMSKLRDPRDIKTFSIAFEEVSFDESSHAKRVAAHFGTDHREKLFTSAELIKLLPEVTAFLDEPLGDASILPTYALSKFTRQSVTVALSGDGGDELFAGYPTFQAEKCMRAYRALPAFLRERVIEPVMRALPVSDANMSFDFKLKQFIKGANVDNPERLFIWICSFSPEEQQRLLAHDLPEGMLSDIQRHAAAARDASGGNRILYLYKKLYLAEDLLTKIDRASMGASLEARAPFLDHDLVEFVARLPYEMKLHGFTTKYILKKAMRPLLPKGIASRPKKGFGIPVAQWVKGPLKEMFQDLFEAGRIRSEGFFRPGEISRLLRDHMDGRADNRKKLWTLFMFEQWLQRFGIKS
ncbi:MAG: asparagine synthase (glutamine-hydrolyzing) [Pseudomonadota bacterium]